jgi:hypothetical protein
LLKKAKKYPACAGYSPIDQACALAMDKSMDVFIIAYSFLFVNRKMKNEKKNLYGKSVQVLD